MCTCTCADAGTPSMSYVKRLSNRFLTSNQAPSFSIMCPAVLDIFKRGVHVRTCRCIPFMTCGRSVTHTQIFSQWRRHGGGQTGQLPPPPTSDRTPREIDADPRRFSCRKNGGRFTGFAPTFYMNRRYGGRSLVLRLRKRGSCKSC